MQKSIKSVPCVAKYIMNFKRILTSKMKHKIYLTICCKEAMKSPANIEFFVITSCLYHFFFLLFESKTIVRR